MAKIKNQNTTIIKTPKTPIKTLIKTTMKTLEEEKPKIQGLSAEERNALSLKVDKARWWLLIQDSPEVIFYAQLVMGLNDQFVKSESMTACTNGRVIKWGSKFLEGLDDEETRGILIHEAMHPGFGHLWRFEPSPRANIACDYGINLVIDKMIKKGVKIKLPKGGLLDYKYDNMAEEEIYQLIKVQEIKVGKGGGGKGGGGKGDDDGYQGIGDFEEPDESGNGDPEDGGSVSKDSLKDTWERRLIQSSSVISQLKKGDLPADIERLINSKLVIRINWREETANFIKNCVKYKKDYTRSTRRQQWQPVIYPRNKRDEYSVVSATRDTSGSIGGPVLDSFNGLLESLVGEIGCKLFLTDCDAAIAAEYIIEAGDPIPDRAKGGGGTAFEPIFAHVKKKIEDGEEIGGMIILTDLYGSFPPQEDVPNIPVLWLSITKDQQAPFGRTVFVEI